MSADSSNIHRYLDEAFAGITVTPEVQDLKEELRGNLAARVSELVERGADADAAATIAVNELGDIRELIEQVEQVEPSGASTAEYESRDAGNGARFRLTADWVAAQRLNRVRPKPGYVIRTVILSLLLAASALLVALGGWHLLDWATAALPFVGLAAALCGGGIVADCLRQETSRLYPLPATRALLYGGATALGIAGIVAVVRFLGNTSEPAAIVVASILVLAAIVGFIWLGTTQTNRTKPWARTLQRQYAGEDRFSQDPVAAARFGIYTAIIWVLAFAGFILLSVTTGFAWSWLVLLAGFAVFMLTLARMLFPDDSGNGRKDRMDR